MWTPLAFALSDTGSENGIILKDEEYKGACRVTLEKCSRYYAITCGVYGGMVHTVFCSKETFEDIYLAIKKDLATFIDTDASIDEECAFYDYFTDKY